MAPALRRMIAWLGLLLALVSAGCGLEEPALVSFATIDADPTWSPDGRRLAYEREDGGIVTAAIARGRRHRIATGFAPAWSPDGRLIAFEYEKALWEVQADGRGEARRLADGGGNPSWAPDSRHIVYEVLHDHGRYTRRASSLSVVDVETGDVRVLTFGGSAWDDPAWRDAIIGKTTF